MKTTVFEKLIRKVVREEIDYALRREIKSLKEDLREELKPQVVEQSTQRTPIPKSVQTSLKEKIMCRKSINQQFTSNSALNDLLNETAQGDTNLESLSPPEPPMPVEIANVVNRDYRELMKAMDKRKNSRP